METVSPTITVCIPFDGLVEPEPDGEVAIIRFAVIMDFTKFAVTVALSVRETAVEAET